MKLPRTQKAFTLIELMIAVSIVAILTAIAYPSYQEYVRRGHRSDTQAFLMDIAQRQQQYLLNARSYAPDLKTLYRTAADADAVPSTVTPFYTIQIVLQAGPPQAFTVTATPIGSQVKDGWLRIDNTGRKTREMDPGYW